MNRRTFINTVLLLMASWLVPLRHATAGKLPSSPAQNLNVKFNSKVIRVCDNHATNWDYKTPPYISQIHYATVKKMLETGLLTLTDSLNLKNAWRLILSQYRNGEKIIIKPNFNNTEIGYSKAIMTSPQVVTAIIESLIEAGYPANDIIVFDLTAAENRDIKLWLQKFPVQIVFRRPLSNFWDKIVNRLDLGLQAADGNSEIHLQSVIKDPDNGRPVKCYIPRVLANAHHLINVPVLKAHQFVLQSSALKNHFGTVRFSNRNSYPVVLHGDKIEANIVDLNRNDHIRLKTRIIIADALFGAGCFTREGYGRTPTPWKTLSAGPTPNSLFFSFDPIAIESVLADYIIQEQKANGFEPYSHEYLHDAMKAGLGIHEHRETNGRYSKIEYKENLS